MSDEQTIYISPDDDLTTVRERLEQLPSRKITLVIPSQTQLRSHVAWKLLYARTRELGKEVLIVSSDPQVRSVAHAVKFKVAHSLESTSSLGRSRGGSRAGTGRSNSGASRNRPTAPSSATAAQATIAKEPTSRRGGSRPSRSTHPPLSGRTPPWSDSGPSEGRGQAPPLRRQGPLRQQEPVQREEPQTGIPREPRSQRSKRAERNEAREERGAPPNQIYGFRAEGPSAIHPLPLNQIEEPDLLIEDYNQAQDIRQAASGGIPVVQTEDEGAGPVRQGESPAPMAGNVNMHVPEVVETSPTLVDQPHRQIPPTYGEDDPFIYMQDDSQPPVQPEQKAETIVHDDEISLGFPFLQKSAISDLPTNVIERETKYPDEDEDDSIPPIGSPGAGPGATSARSRDYKEERPSRLSPRPYGVPPWGEQVQSGDKPRVYESPARQDFDEEEDQLPALPEPTAPMQVPQPISLPMPRAQSKPLARTSRPLAPRTSGQMPQQAPAQKPRTGPTTRNGSRVPTSAGSRPASQAVQQPRGPASPKSTVGVSTGARRPATRNRLRRPKRLYLVLASIVAIFVILFGVLYLNTTSTVKLTVITQNYSHPVTLTLSANNQSGTVPAKSVSNTFTQAGSEPATGSTMQVTNQATGFVNFTNTGTVPIQIESGTTIATASNIQFVTTATALIPTQNPNTVPLPVPIQASNQGVSGNVPAKSITVVPQGSLESIAAAQFPPVTADSLKATLTVSNPEATTGGDAHQVPAVSQQDLDNAKQDLHQQLVGAINGWVQQNAKNALVGKLVTTDTLTNPPAVDTPEPNKIFSASISVVATILVAQLNDVRGIAANQLTNAVNADQQFALTFKQVGPPFAIIGDVSINLAQQSASDSKTVTVPVSGKAGPSLNKADLQNSIKGKSFGEAKAILQKQQGIKAVNIETQPGIFNWVSPWMDHINMIIEAA